MRPSSKMDCSCSTWWVRCGGISRNLMRHSDTHTCDSTHAHAGTHTHMYMCIYIHARTRINKHTHLTDIPTSASNGVLTTYPQTHTRSNAIVLPTRAPSPLANCNNHLHSSLIDWRAHPGYQPDGIVRRRLPGPPALWRHGRLPTCWTPSTRAWACWSRRSARCIGRQPLSSGATGYAARQQRHCHS